MIFEILLPNIIITLHVKQHGPITFINIIAISVSVLSWMFPWVSVSRRHTCTSSVHERVQPSQQVLFQEFALILTALSIFPSFLPVPTNPEPFFFPTLPLLSIYKRCTFQYRKKRCLEQAMQLICESVEPCLRFALIPFLT